MLFIGMALLLHKQLQCYCISCCSVAASVIAVLLHRLLQ